MSRKNNLSTRKRQHEFELKREREEREKKEKKKAEKQACTMQVDKKHSGVSKKRKGKGFLMGKGKKAKVVLAKKLKQGMDIDK